MSTKLFWTSGPTAFTPAAGLSRKFIIEAVEASLARLQLSYIDIVLINKLDGMCPMEEIVRAMQHILDKGKIMYWGTSRWSPVHIMEAFTVARQFNLTPPAVEQVIASSPLTTITMSHCDESTLATGSFSATHLSPSQQYLATLIILTNNIFICTIFRWNTICLHEKKWSFTCLNYTTNWVWESFPGHLIP